MSEISTRNRVAETALAKHQDNQKRGKLGMTLGAIGGDGCAANIKITGVAWQAATRATISTWLRW